MRADDGTVRIHSSLGVVTLAANQVSHIEASETREARAERISAAAPDDPQTLFELAREMKADGAETLARRLFERVLDLEPDHAGANLELGNRLFEGVWVSTREFHELRGEVLYRGEWITLGERAQLILTEQELARDAMELRRRRAYEELLWRQTLHAQTSAQRTPPQTTVQGIPMEWVLQGPSTLRVDRVQRRAVRPSGPEARSGGQPRSVRTTPARPVETRPAPPPGNRGRFRRN